MFILRSQLLLGLSWAVFFGLTAYVVNRMENIHFLGLSRTFITIAISSLYIGLTSILRRQLVTKSSART